MSQHTQLSTLQNESSKRNFETNKQLKCSLLIKDSSIWLNAFHVYGREQK